MGIYFRLVYLDYSSSVVNTNLKTAKKVARRYGRYVTISWGWLGLAAFHVHLSLHMGPIQWYSPGVIWWGGWGGKARREDGNGELENGEYQNITFHLCCSMHRTPNSMTSSNVQAATHCSDEITIDLGRAAAYDPSARGSHNRLW